jgi:O-antigen ligase
LNFRDNTITNAFRESLITVLTIYFPYFTISRYIQTSEQLRSVITALFIGIFPLTIIGIFEAVKHWHLYDSLSLSLTEIPARKNRYDSRAGLLRATTVFAGPIVYGYAMVIGIGLLLYFRPLISKLHFKLSLLLFVIALICSFSRGPWVGLGLLFVVYFWSEKGGVKKIITMGLAGSIMLPLLSLTTFGQKFIDLLPIIGTSRVNTIDYRERLLEQAWIVIQRQPWFGSTTFRETPEMESMRQGQGIIDIVNSYLQIILSYGTIGLFLFLAIFFGLLYRCYKMLNRLPKEETELIRMGKSLFATLAAILFIIFTVSSIDYIPIFYWTFAGITAAYLNICNQVLKSISIKKGYKKQIDQ